MSCAVTRRCYQNFDSKWVLNTLTLLFTMFIMLDIAIVDEYCEFNYGLNM
jgi:hypothetical protein